jgi:hypothetical protein
MSGEDRRLLEEWKWKIDELKINLDSPSDLQFQQQQLSYRVVL